ncbi:MAG TPA: sulfatase-like hydrolase/transferase [Candidatus Polarisedimenticolaceae bacterium]|nr:sulfatase-like hydrolase/transferase [Candidatus Polarisedimenticolaceae bacterium]
MIAPFLLAVTLAAAPARTSVVLITLDTTRADHLGCYGAKDAATPALDATARGGARFTRALSPVPLTLPAHASLLSGRVPRRHGVRDNAGFRLDSGVPLLTERLREAGYATAAFVSAAVLDREGGLDRGFATYDDTVRIGDRRAFDYQERAASQTVDRVLARLPQLPVPYFLWVHLYDPHLPYVPPEPYASRFKGRPYDGEIAFMDTQVGRLIAALRAKGAPFYLAIAGDHGEGLGEHGEESHGVFLYQATQRVPLILAGPGIAAGSVPAASVGLIDVAPTLLDLLHLPPLAGADGRSLAPLLAGKPAASPVYEMETFYPSFSYGWAPLRAVVSAGSKYIEAPRPELYDLSADAREARDLARERPERARELSRTLATLTEGDIPPRPREDEETGERREKLASLGYVGGSAAPRDALDPKDGVKLLPDLDAARRAIQLGDPKDALPPLTRLLERNPANIPARLALGQAQLATGRAAEAVATYRAVTDLAPANALAWFDLGNAHAAQAAKDDAAFAEAKRAYERALVLAPRHADTYLNYAAVLAVRRAPDESRKLLLRARDAGVSDPTIETEIGVLEAARGEPAAAKAALERAIALNPRQPEALEALGRLAYEAGRHADAALYYERALDAHPSAALAKTLGAIRLYELADKPGARAAFTRALALSPPGDPDADALRALLEEIR